MYGSSMLTSSMVLHGMPASIAPSPTVAQSRDGSRSRSGSRRSRSKGRSSRPKKPKKESSSSERDEALSKKEIEIRDLVKEMREFLESQKLVKERGSEAEQPPSPWFGIIKAGKWIAVILFGSL